MLPKFKFYHSETGKWLSVIALDWKHNYIICNIDENPEIVGNLILDQHKLKQV